MGAQEFTQRAKGKNASDAFLAARDAATWEYGHGGYTGTIAEKFEFVEIPVPDGKAPVEFANDLLAHDDKRVSDKWGPAGCVKVSDGEYYFFGWASS